MVELNFVENYLSCAEENE